MTVLMTVEVADTLVRVGALINLTVNHPVPEPSTSQEGPRRPTLSSPPCRWVCTSTSPMARSCTPLVRCLDSTVLTATNSGGTAEGEFILAVRAEPGCTDPMATNFDPLAGQDDGTCIGVDSDGDGTLDEDEVNGCTPGSTTTTSTPGTDGSCVGNSDRVPCG